MATKRRLLQAAVEEFAERGVAGTRIERVVAAARSNKSQLYAYFGSKDKLFDAVMTETVDAITDAAPFDGRDLPEYAVALYDIYLARPELVRLAAWTRLERRPEGSLFGFDQAKLDQIADAQAAGVIDGSLEPTDVLSVVSSMAMTWSASSITVAATPNEPADVHTRRREALRRAVRKAFAPGDR